MSSPNANPGKGSAWQNLCQESGWRSKICGAFPEIGEQFEKNLWGLPAATEQLRSYGCHL